MMVNRFMCGIAMCWVFTSCGGWRAPGDQDVSVQQSALTATSATIVLKTPATVPTTSVVLAANGTLVINAGTTVTGPGPGLGTPIVVSNMGTAGSSIASGSRIEPDAVVNGGIWSASGLDLRDRVQVLGTAHASTITRGNGVTVGSVDAHPALAPATVTQWTVALPASGAAVSIGPGLSGSRSPGSYAGVHVFSGATLSLTTGTYYLDTLLLEPGAIVRLDQAKGPVVIYVRNTLQLRGTFRATNGTAAPDLLLVYLGTSDVSAEAPFVGTLIAQQARLFLGSISPGHVGAFFAKNIEVGPHTKVTFRAPHPLLIAAGLPVKACIDAIVPDLSLSGKAREEQYQSDITRYCTGRDLGPCEAAVVARLNVDFFSIASQLYREAISPAQYLAILQDRHAKLKALRGNETQSCAIIQGDGDGDFVPDGQDGCPATPDLTPTLANGCTNTALPAAPTITDMRKAFGGMGISGDPRCDKAPSPGIPAPLGAWRFPADPTAGKAAWVSRDVDTSGCPMWYQIDVELTDGAGTRRILFKPIEDTTLPWIVRPAGVVQFHLTTADPADRGAWASYAVFTKRYRARAINGGGRRSSWSNWFTPGTEDCLAGRCPDGRVP